MAGELERILVRREDIARRVEAMAGELEAMLQADEAARGESARLVLVPVLTGAMIFVADLIRCLERRLRISVVRASSYHGTATRSSGSVALSEIPPDLAGCDVVLVDDILDSGRTLGALQAAIREQAPRTLRTCVLLRKDVERTVHADCDLVGFDIPDAFVVGYGLDHGGLHRNLPDIGVLRVDAVTADAADRAAATTPILPGLPREPGERVLVDRRSDVLDGPLSALWFLAAAAGLAAGLRALAAFGRGAWLDPGDVTLVFVLVAAVRLVWGEIVRRLRRHVLTDRRMAVRFGVFRRTTVTVPLHRVQHAVVVRRFRDRLAGIGSVGFTTAGTGGTDLVWAGVRDPDAIHAAAIEAIRAARQGDSDA